MGNCILPAHFCKGIRVLEQYLDVEACTINGHCVQRMKILRKPKGEQWVLSKTDVIFEISQKGHKPGYLKHRR